MVRIPSLEPKISFLSLVLRPAFDLSSRFHNVGSLGFNISSPIDRCLSLFAVFVAAFSIALTMPNEESTLVSEKHFTQGKT
jgi:hypothetical protein